MKHDAHSTFVKDASCTQCYHELQTTKKQSADIIQSFTRFI